MSNIVLKAENISKQYRLGQLGTGTISHDINRWWHKLRGKEDPYLKVGDTNDRSKAGGSDYVWSLKDINFEVKQGEVLGIIGKNGAGKSTLLKILSQVTSPTTGQVKVKGRIAALLEVGTGFHPELTGRENIFLNGAILGMTKAEIKSKFDEIVDFSGVAKYLDTPVKRYSSGMMVRLGFAVAAHLEPEILIVDEVLAVGDAEFQKKCLGKMKDVAGQGRTVLFVSHNMAAVQNLCSKGLVLERGRIVSTGTAINCLDYYLNSSNAIISENNISGRTDRKGALNLKIIGIEFLNKGNETVEMAFSGQPLKFKLFYNCKKGFQLDSPSVAISLTRQDGVLVTVLCNDYTGNNFGILKGEGFIICEIDKLPLMQGNYYLNIMINKGSEIEDWIQDAAILIVENGDFYGTGKTIEDTHKSFLIEHKWSKE